ncbi:MAG TPA: hypothetical protein VIE37_02715, partial [Methylomirabilota bacterium]
MADKVQLRFRVKSDDHHSCPPAQSASDSPAPYGPNGRLPTGRGLIVIAAVPKNRVEAFSDGVLAIVITIM